MGTKNSGVSAKLSLDTMPWEKSLKEAESKYKDFSARIVRTQGIDLRAKDHSPLADSGNTGTERSRRPEIQRAYADSVRRTNEALYLNGKLVRDNTAAVGRLGQAGSGAGQGILQLGYALDDLQYGIRGVANNIPLLVQSFTGSMAAAGLVGIAVTAGAVLYSMGDRIIGASKATEKLAKANEEAAESYKKLRDGMIASAEAWGRAEGAFEAGRTGREDAGRTSRGKFQSRAESLQGSQDQIALAEAGRLEGTKRLRAELEITHAAEVRHAKLTLDTARADLRHDLEELASADQQVEATKDEIEAIQKRMDAKEREWKKEQFLEQARNNQFKEGSKYRTSQFQGEFVPDNNDASRLAYLRELLPDITQRRDGLKTRAGELDHTIAGADQRLNKELPNERAAAIIRIETEEKQALAKSIQSAVEGLDSAWKSITETFSTGAAKIAARRASEVRSVGEGLKQAWDSLTGSVADAAAHIAERRAGQQAGIDRTKRDLAIAETRSPARRRRLQRAADLADTTQKLIDEGHDPADAADIAARQQKATDRASGDRTIRGAGPARTYQGLDAFRNRTDSALDGNVPTPRDAATSRSRAALRKASDDADKAGVAGSSEAGKYVKELLQKMDQIIQATGKTPVERTAAVRRAA